MMLSIGWNQRILATIFFSFCIIIIEYWYRQNFSSNLRKYDFIKSVWSFLPTEYRQDYSYFVICSSLKRIVSGWLLLSLLFLLLLEKFSHETSASITSILLVILNVNYIRLIWQSYSKFMLLRDTNYSGTKARGSNCVGWNAKVRMDRENDKRLPVTIVTGFLGSGKTTLVRNILKNAVGIKILVVENEIGAEGVDHELLLSSTSKENVVLLENGCICCSVRGDLIQTFHRLFKSPSLAALDWVIIETTGLADPAPIINSFLVDTQCRRFMRLDSVVAVVDSFLISNVLNVRDAPAIHEKGTMHEAIKQILHSDMVLLNKSDLVSVDALAALSAVISSLNATCKIQRCVRSAVSIDTILNRRSFDLSRLTLDHLKEQQLVCFPSSAAASESEDSTRETESDGSKLDGRVSISENYATVTLLSNRPLDLYKLSVWLSELVKDRGGDLFRMKGMSRSVCVGCSICMRLTKCKYCRHPLGLPMQESIRDAISAHDVRRGRGKSVGISEFKDTLCHQ